MFEQTVAMPVQYEMLYVGEWRQNLLLAERYARRPRAARRRRRASGDPDRRARHEHRRRRRHRLVLEARRHAARLGRAGPARVLRDRAAAGRRTQCRRPRAMPRSAGASGARNGGRRSATTRRRAPRRARISRGRRRRTAQDQRDDRRRARLPLSSARRWSAESRATGRPTISSITRRAHAGRAAAACLARRRRADAGLHRRRLYAAAAWRQQGGWVGRSPRRSRTLGAPFTVLDCRRRRARDVYGYDLILVRPDLHVVWRGNTLPDDPARLAAMATGMCHSVRSATLC